MIACLLFISLLLYLPFLVSAIATVSPASSDPNRNKRTPGHSLPKTPGGLPNPREYFASLLDQTSNSQDSTNVFISGLGSIYSAWLLTALGLIPLIYFSLLVGDAHVFGLVSIFVCQMAPIHLLTSGGGNRRSKKNDVTGKCKMHFQQYR